MANENEKTVYVGQAGVQKLWERVVERDVVLDEKKIDKVIDAEGNVPVFLANGNIADSDKHIVTAKYDDVSGEVRSDYEGNLVTGHAVEEAVTAAVEDLGDDIQDKLDALDAAKADKVAGENLAGKVVISMADGNPESSGRTIVDDVQVVDPVTQETSIDYQTFNENIPTGNAVLDVVTDQIGIAVDSLDSSVSGNSTNVSVTVTETNGKLTGISVSDNAATSDHIHGNISNDGKIGSTEGLSVVTGTSGVVTVKDMSYSSPATSSLEFIDSVTQGTDGQVAATKKAVREASTAQTGVVQLSNAIDSESVSMAATPKAVKSAIDAVNTHIASINCNNQLAAGKYITSLSQSGGQLAYSVENMDTSPNAGSAKPVTSGGVQTALQTETNARIDFDTWVQAIVPTAATHLNQLADKAYVDAIGERLEARYLASTATNLPFSSKSAFNTAAALNKFWYDGQQTAADNNDVVVVTADESKREMSTTGNDPTTRYRYIAHKVQKTDTQGNPVYDDQGNPVWETDANGKLIWEGQWYFEYVINNSALNQDQLLAINSGITSTKVGEYDAHLANTVNPHDTTYTQVAAEEGIATTAAEIGVLHGITASTTELNYVDGVTSPIQTQIDGKANRVSPSSAEQGYTASGKIVIVSDTADINGKYDIKDSGASITQYYNGSDTKNPATGSAIKQAIDDLDATVTSFDSDDPNNSGATPPKVIATVTETNGLLTGVSIDDSNAATATQGGYADSAIQSIKLNGSFVTKTGNSGAKSIDLGYLKTTQTPVSITGNPLKTVNTITQNANGEINVTFQDITVDSTYSASGTNPVNGTAITAAFNTLDATESSASGQNVQVTVTQTDGKITGVSVTDNSANATDIENAINGLDVSNTLTAGNYITSLSESNGKIVVDTEAMDTQPSAGSKAPVTSGGVYKAISDAVTALDVSKTGGDGKYIKAISETDGKIDATAEDLSTYPAEDSNVPVTSGGVYTALADTVNSLDVSDLVRDESGNMAGKTLLTLSETDGKIAATFQDIEITKSQVSDFPDEMPPTEHEHGNLQDDGTLQTNDVTVASGDKLVVTDGSDSSKLARSSIEFDGVTDTTALTPKGTWESFKRTQEAVTEATPDTGSTLTFISSVTQDTNGVITPKTKTVSVDSALSSSSTNPVQNKVVKSALDTKTEQYTITQPGAYKCFAIIEDVTRWYNQSQDHGITSFYQMVGCLSWWRKDTGHDTLGTEYMAYHLNYAWKLEDTNCFELKYTESAKEARIYPALLKDARDPNDVKYYFGLRTKIAYASIIQFIGRLRSLKFSDSNVTWIDAAGSNTDLPANVSLVAEPSTMPWHVKYADQLYTSRKLTVNLGNTDTDSYFNGTADATNIRTTGVLAVAHGGTGTNTAEGAANTLMSGLPVWDAAPSDSTYMIRQNRDGTNRFGRVPFSTVWSYLKGKMESDTDVDISGNAATATSADLTLTTDATNGDQLQIGSGTPVNIGNAVHANTADSLTTPRTVYVTLGTASTSTARDFSGDTTIPVDGILPVANGGTGASTAAGARTNLDVFSKDETTNFVNSSIATATAEFLGTLSLTDLSLNYGATNAQIAAALASHSWPAGVTPDNNDYCFVAINNPQTTSVDEYRRFKFDGTEWKYEYTLNNSSFTQAQWDAINSGLSAGDKTAYDAHIGDTTSNPHNVTKAQVGLGNVVNTGDSDTPVSGGTTKFTTGGAYVELEKKTDKVTGATENNFVSFDDAGNIKDSGKNAASFKTVQSAVSDPTVPSTGTTTSLSFIDTISQNANGEITATKKNVLVDSTYSASGTNPVNGTAIADALGTLDVSDIVQDESDSMAGMTLRTLSETDGKIAATFQPIKISGLQIIDSDLTPTADSDNTVTSGGVKAALDLKANDSAVVHLAGTEQITGEKQFKAGYSLLNDGNRGYVAFILQANQRGTVYDDWPAAQKDGNHFREWRIKFPTGASYWGRVRITITGGYSNYNASGILSRTLNVAFNEHTCYLNVGNYDTLGYNVDTEFRISDLVWNDTDSRWEIIIHSVQPTSNNQNEFAILEFWSPQANYLNFARSVNWVNRTASIVTSTSYTNTYLGKTVQWSTKPVLQSPYGYKIFDESMVIPAENIGISAIPVATIDALA